jgi:dye decolorizing peroxidase
MSTPTSSSNVGAPGDSEGAVPVLSRRRFLAGGAWAAGATAAAVSGYTLGSHQSDDILSDAPGVGQDTVSPYGSHQAGITTPLQSHASFLAFDLLPATTLDDRRRWLELLSDDIERLTTGRPALADPQPELASLPARLTITLGFGAGFFAAAILRSQRPDWLGPLPAFRHDELDTSVSGGDVLVQVCCDDPVTLSHARRMLIRDSTSFASLRWVQHGFQRARGVADGQTPRNLMGQVDGTSNPMPADPGFDDAIWHSGEPAWLAGGTALVLRRIRMRLSAWDGLSRDSKEATIGRRLSDGAPLTGGHEGDEPDLDARAPDGSSVIHPQAHVRLARVSDPKQRILRRGYNYEDGPVRDGAPEAGLLFVAAMADPTRQFVPVQRRLDEADLLNDWTRTVGSAVFAVPPGFMPGGYVGATLLT